MCTLEEQGLVGVFSNTTFSSEKMRSLHSWCIYAKYTNADSREGTRGVLALVPQNDSVASSPHKMSLRVKDLPNWFT